jgi:hypothetical protein
MRWSRFLKLRMRVLASLTLWPVLLAYIVAQLSAQRFWINDEILSAKKPLWVIAHRKVEWASHMRSGRRP